MNLCIKHRAKAPFLLVVPVHADGSWLRVAHQRVSSQKLFPVKNNIYKMLLSRVPSDRSLTAGCASVVLSSKCETAGMLPHLGLFYFLYFLFFLFKE